MTDLKKCDQLSEQIAAYVTAGGGIIPSELKSWIEENDENRSFFENLIKEESLEASLSRYNTIDMDSAWNKVQQELFPIKASRLKSLWPRIIGVAAAVAIITFGIWFYNSGQPERRSPEFVSGSSDIEAGKNAATLRLPDGKLINLSDTKNGLVIGNNQLHYNDGSAVLDGAQPLSRLEQQFTISTPRGGTYQVTLPDGTKVWLNAASDLTYQTDLKGVVARRVTLTGEAYFEVQKDKTRPFIVSSKLQDVEVLGTHFNIKNYTDDSSIKTTLLEGSVSVSANTKKDRKENSIILKPGEQASLKANQFVVKQVDVMSAVGWKDGLLVFTGENLKSAMEDIERWYGVTVQYELSSPAEIKLEGWISRKSKLSEVLARIESVGDIHFKIQERRVIVVK
ncbi:FecR family protein [Pedobacter endophyticus]|uniref:FecR domain-containing protein n=1 Tax=Pedobacter endophyticus TaxID=2789740 RepID=A0A7S9Q177_9SPHI|nr:FecR family protein [Pedobacter endophyticus]QPH41482.1 FecR domain-containing protein [Pedobacter endophyticus]